MRPVYHAGFTIQIPYGIWCNRAPSDANVWRELYQKATLSLSPNIATVSFVGFSAGFLIT